MCRNGRFPFPQEKNRVKFPIISIIPMINAQVLCSTTIESKGGKKGPSPDSWVEGEKMMLLFWESRGGRNNDIISIFSTCQDNVERAIENSSHVDHPEVLLCYPRGLDAPVDHRSNV